MAEENKSEGQESGGKSKLPIKALAILLVLLVVEGVVIAVLFMAMGQPADVKAEGAAEDVAAQGEQPVEELAVEGQYPNNKSGKTFIYDAQIYVVVKKKNQQKIAEQLQNMTAQISGDVRTIIGVAEPNHLLEPTLATIKRQIKAALDERLGKDPEGNSYVDQVVITQFTQFRADF